MNQRDFTDYTIPRFEAVFPDFSRYTVDGHEDVCYLELASPNSKLKVLVSTRDKEVTIGFSAGPGLFDWHMQMHDSKSLDEAIIRATEVIKEIISGKTGIIHSSILGYIPGDEEAIDDIKKYQQKDELIEFVYWKDL